MYRMGEAWSGTDGKGFKRKHQDDATHQNLLPVKKYVSLTLFYFIMMSTKKMSACFNHILSSSEKKLSWSCQVMKAALKEHGRKKKKHPCSTSEKEVREYQEKGEEKKEKVGRKGQNWSKKTGGAERRGNEDERGQRSSVWGGGVHGRSQGGERRSMSTSDPHYKGH